MDLMPRNEALRRCLNIVRVFRDAPMASSVTASRNAAGYRGFYFHFLHADGEARGSRQWKSELSTIDTALLVAGLLTAAGFFDDESADAHEVRESVTHIYERIEWDWMLREGGLLSHGWRPEAVHKRRRGHEMDGFLSCRWDGYSEALLLYVLALGSPTHPIPAESYDAWAATYPARWQTILGIDYLHSPALFVHQFPQAFIDFRGIADRFMRDRGIDYFENGRRATLAQIEYAKLNPQGFEGYGKDLWGISASNGPGIEHRVQIHRDGRELRFMGYRERGLPPPATVVDDGTLAPWATAASLPYLPDAVLRSIRAHRDVMLCRPGWSGFMGSYNLTYIDDDCPHGWVDEFDLGIEQGPIVMMAANHTKDAIWSISRCCEPIRRGLRRAGFTGGWLEE